MKPGMGIHRIAYIAIPEISPISGMGRIAWEWRAALARRGIDLVDFAGPCRHQNRHLAALRIWAAARRAASGVYDAFLVHEPLAWTIGGERRPSIIFSHGVESRGREAFKQMLGRDGETIKSRCINRVLAGPIRRAFQKSRLFLTSNSEDCTYLTDKYGLAGNQLFLFRNGVDPMPWTESRAGIPRPVRILFAGTWIGRKGIVTLVAAATRLRSEGVAVQWCLAGTGVAAEAVRQHFPAHLREAIEVIPRFAREEEANLLLQSDLFVLPSFFEGQPLALLQAMEAGCAVIASDTCGQRDILQHNENGWLFPPGDVAALVRLIRQACENATLRRQIGAAAHASMAHRRWPAVADEVAGKIVAAVDASRCPPGSGENCQA